MMMCGIDVMHFLGLTSLIKASKRGNLFIVKHLLEHKANIEAKSTKPGMFLDSVRQFSLVCMHSLARILMFWC